MELTFDISDVAEESGSRISGRYEVGRHRPSDPAANDNGTGTDVDFFVSLRHEWERKVPGWESSGPSQSPPGKISGPASRTSSFALLGVTCLVLALAGAWPNSRSLALEFLCNGQTQLEVRLHLAFLHTETSHTQI